MSLAVGGSVFDATLGEIWKFRSRHCAACFAPLITRRRGGQDSCVRPSHNVGPRLFPYALYHTVLMATCARDQAVGTCHY